MLNAIWLRHGQDESHNRLGRVLRLVVEQWGAANPTKSSWRDDTAKMEEEKHHAGLVTSVREIRRGEKVQWRVEESNKAWWNQRRAPWASPPFTLFIVCAQSSQRAFSNREWAHFTSTACRAYREGKLIHAVYWHSWSIPKVDTHIHTYTHMHTEHEYTSAAAPSLLFAV